MKDTESLTGVKVTTILPALVNTPLITPDKAAQFSVRENRALSPEDVARNMLALLQEKAYGCGTVFEVSLSGTRLVPEWNIDPPSGSGTGQDAAEIDAGGAALLTPIKEKLETEREYKS